jgi:hypothetical protein
MSNPFKSINVNSIANAVKRTFENQKAHAEHREEKRMDAMVQEIEDLASMEIENAIQEILPKAEAVIAKNMLLPERGYFATHRTFGHLLPDRLRWTVAGVEVINAVLARMPVTASFLPQWEFEIAQHIEETRINTEKHAERQEAYTRENEQFFRAVCDEIVRLFKVNHPDKRNYARLLSYMRHGAPRGFGGARGVEIIHRAMKAKIEHIDHWGPWMDEKLAEAKARDLEYKERMRSQNQR